MRFSISSILLIGILLAGCSGAAPELPSRIVLITIPGVSSAEASDLASLRALMQEADWAGRGVASSSYIVPAAASLFTGLSPWNHQVIHAGQSRLREDLFTLAEALGELGYRGTGLSSSPWTSARNNYDAGFDRFESWTPETHSGLERAAEGKEFFWIQLRTHSLHGPHREPLRASNSEIDAQLNEILRDLESSTSWPETLLVVTAEHGSFPVDPQEAFAPLERRTLEVPLAIRFPVGSALSIAADTGDRVAIARLWATLVESAGGHPVPAAATSLYRDADTAIISELYRAQGANLFSLVDDDFQWLIRVPFLAEASPRGRTRRQAGIFAVHRPFSGLGRRETLLLRWHADGTTSRITDEAKQEELDRALKKRWSAFVDLERTPSAEFALRPQSSESRTATSSLKVRAKERRDH